MNKKYLILFYSACFLLIFTECGYAAGEDIGAINSVVSAFKSGLSPIASSLQSAATAVFSSLALIQFVWSMYQIALDGKLDMQAWVMTIVKTIIYIGVFAMFVKFGYTWLTEIGQYISGILGDQSSSISDMVSSSFSMADAPKNALADYVENGGGKDLLGVTEILNDFKYLGALLVAWFGGIVILCIMCMAFINAIYIQIKLYVVTCFSVFALGFGGLTYTKDIAITGIKKVISAAVELMVIYALITCANNVFSYFENYKLSDFSDSYTLTTGCIFAALIFMMMFKALPGDIASMFGGGGGGGGGATLVAAAGAVMGAATSLSRAAGKLAGGSVGAAAAVKERGLGGAIKEGVKNRVENAKNNILGRRNGGGGGGGYVSPPGSGKP